MSWDRAATPDFLPLALRKMPPPLRAPKDGKAAGSSTNVALSMSISRRVMQRCSFTPNSPAPALFELPPGPTARTVSSIYRRKKKGTGGVGGGWVRERESERAREREREREGKKKEKAEPRYSAASRTYISEAECEDFLCFRRRLRCGCSHLSIQLKDCDPISINPCFAYWKVLN